MNTSIVLVFLFQRTPIFTYLQSIISRLIYNFCQMTHPSSITLNNIEVNMQKNPNISTDYGKYWKTQFQAIVLKYKKYSIFKFTYQLNIYDSLRLDVITFEECVMLSLYSDELLAASVNPNVNNLSNTLTNFVNVAIA